MTCSRASQAGFSYTEVLVATLLIAITLVPAMEALTGGLTAAVVHGDATSRSLRVASRMDEVLAESFNTLDAAALAAGSPTVASSLSDPSGTANRRLVYLSRYDGDNADTDGDPFTGVDSNLLWVRVEIENAGHGLDTLVLR